MTRDTWLSQHPLTRSPRRLEPGADFGREDRVRFEEEALYRGYDVGLGPETDIGWGEERFRGTRRRERAYPARGERGAPTRRGDWRGRYAREEPRPREARVPWEERRAREARLPWEERRAPDERAERGVRRGERRRYAGPDEYDREYRYLYRIGYGGEYRPGGYPRRRRAYRSTAYDEEYGTPRRYGDWSRRRRSGREYGA